MPLAPEAGDLLQYVLCLLMLGAIADGEYSWLQAQIASRHQVRLAGQGSALRQKMRHSSSLFTSCRHEKYRGSSQIRLRDGDPESARPWKTTNQVNFNDLTEQLPFWQGLACCRMVCLSHDAGDLYIGILHNRHDQCALSPHGTIWCSRSVILLVLGR